MNWRKIPTLLLLEQHDKKQVLSSSELEKQLVMKQKDIIGWIGVLLILAAFTLATFSIVDAKDTIYGVLNLIGALGIIISSYAKNDFQPIILNAIWLLVAAIGIIRSLSLN